MNKIIGRYAIAAIIIWIVSAPCFGQPGGGGPGGGAPPPDVPISGIEILIGLGGLLGARKLFNSRKKN